MDEDTQLLNPRQVAEILGVHQKTVHLWLRSGRLEGTKISYRAWRIPRSALDSFIKKNSNTRSLQNVGLPKGNDGESNSMKSGKQKEIPVEVENGANDISPRIRMKHYIQDIMREQPIEK